MNFADKLSMYARLIVRHGMNVQPGQDVFIAAEVIHRDLVALIVKEAYEVGARFVNVDLQDPRNDRTRIVDSQNPDFLSYVAPHIPFRFESMLPETAASLRLIGPEFPDILADLDPQKVQQVSLNYRKSLKKFYEEGIGHSKVQWTIAAAATPAWGKKVFPELEEQEACAALWETIFTICRADKKECLELWKKHNSILAERAKKLTDMQIELLHFTGPGTDLKVGLCPKARFKGGTSHSARGKDFEPNLPTEECFTTPDYHKTTGHVQTTRPFLINGKMIRGLSLVFDQGEIVSFSAHEGQETFAAYINSDPGAKRLGEVALVGIDSPIFQSGRIFEEILFDENAACHIAVGFAYRFCIAGSAEMSAEELDNSGCNTSSVHTDMMISSEQVDVEALLYSGKRVKLISQGVWQPF